MQTIQKKLTFILLSCSFAAILVTSIFVNLSMNKKFDEYVKNVEPQRKNELKVLDKSKIPNNAKVSIILSKEDLEFKRAINRNIVVSGMITIFFVSIISIYISKQFSIPIKEVSNTSVRLSNGDYHFRSNIRSDIFELENLRNSINFLGDNLRNQEVIRKRLVSDISHEIRTPLNVLQNNLEAMIDGVFPITEEKLVSLNEEVIRFSKLLDNLNMLENYDEEINSLDIKKVDLNELILAVCNDFEVAFREKNIELITNIPSKESYIIEGDEGKLKQVFINILSNAVKFNKYNGKIWISLSGNKKNVVVTIKDTGIGINEDDLPFIFERLYRGDKSRHEVEGNGIGLTIVKKILLLHSATIDVESEERKGSNFIITFNKEL